MWFVLAVLLTCSSQQPTVIAVTNEAIASRAKLSRNYTLKFALSTVHRDPDQQRVSSVENWSTRQHFRVDDTRTVNTKQPDDIGRRWIYCRQCERQGYELRTIQGGKDKSLAQVQFTAIKPDAKEDEPYVFDWMRLGQLHGYTASYLQEPADSTIQLLRKRGQQVEDIEYSGLRCKSIRFVTPDGGSIAGFFCPAYGMNPVYYLNDVPRSKWRSETLITYSKLPGDKGWFPKEVTHRRTRDGIDVLTQHLVVNSVEVNADVPASVFTVAGIGLDIGQPIAFPELKDPNKHPTWGREGVDWSKTVGKFTREAHLAQLQQAVPPPMPDKPPSSKWLYYGGAAVLAAVAVGAGVLIRRRRAQLGT